MSRDVDQKQALDHVQIQEQGRVQRDVHQEQPEQPLVAQEPVQDVQERPQKRTEARTRRTRTEAPTNATRGLSEATRSTRTST